MQINDWFTNGCDYDQGVALYAALNKSNHNLVRLFKRKHSTNNEAKLKYELSKFRDVTVLPLVAVVNTEKVNPQVDLNQARSLSGVEVPPTNTYRPLKINELPVELHPMFIQQKTDFHTACSSKIILDALEPEQEQEALELCIKIEELFDSIERAWKVFDYYIEHGTILNVATTNFSDLSAAQLIQRRNQLRTRLSKEKSKITAWNTALSQAATKALQTKLNTKIAKAEEKKLQLETDIAKLTELIVE